MGKTTEELEHSIAENKSYQVGGRAFYQLPGGLRSPHAYLRWLDEQDKLQDATSWASVGFRELSDGHVVREEDDGFATPLFLKAALNMANIASFVEACDARTAEFVRFFRVRDSTAFLRGFFPSEQFPKTVRRGFSAWLDAYGDWLKDEKTRARANQDGIARLVEEGRNNAYVWGGRAFYETAVETRHPKGMYALGYYELWIGKQWDLIGETFWGNDPKKRVKIPPAKRDRARVTLVAINMANNKAFREFHALKSQAPLDDLDALRAPDDDTLAAWLADPSRCPRQTSGEKLPLGSYTLWLDQQQDKVQLALAGEQPIEDVLGDKERQELEDQTALLRVPTTDIPPELATLLGKPEVSERHKIEALAKAKLLPLEVTERLLELEPKEQQERLALLGGLGGAQEAALDYVQARHAHHEKKAQRKDVRSRAHKLLRKYSRGDLLLTGYTTDKMIRDLEALERDLDLRDPKTADLANDIAQIDSFLGRDPQYNLRKLEEAEQSLRADKHTAKAQQKQAAKKVRTLTDEIRKFNEDYLRAFGELRRTWKLMKKSPEGSILDKPELYQSVAGLIAYYAARQRALLARRELLDMQVEQLEKIDKFKRGLRIYCAFANASWYPILWTGKLVTNDYADLAVHGLATMGSMGMLAATLSAGDDAGEKFFLGNFLPKAADLLKLAKVTDMDTGKLEITLSLGLAGTIHEVLELGVALVYTGTLSYGDDRGFASVGKFTIEGEASLGVKNVLQSAAKADFVEDTTEFKFKDVYHWAAWVAQKWANTAAWFFGLGANLYKGSKWEEPTKEEWEFIAMVADAYRRTDPTLKATLDWIAPFMNDKHPVRYGHAFELATKAEVSASAAGLFGLGGSVQRSGLTYFLRSTDDGAVDEKQREAKTWAKAVNVKIPELAMKATRSSVSNHPNPDANGDFANFNFTIGGMQTDIVKTSAEPAPEWVDEGPLKAFKDLHDKISSSSVVSLSETEFWKSESVGVAQQLNLANFEIHCALVADDKGHLRPRMQYLRGIWSSKVGASTGVPVAPGLKLQLGASAALTRTFGERLGTGTMSYLHLVYDGLTGIPPATRRVHKGNKDVEEKIRPRSGAELWERFKKVHASDFHRFFHEIGKSASPVRTEIEGVTKQFPLLPVTALCNACKDYKRERFDAAMKAMDAYLAAYNRHVFAYRKEHPPWEHASPKLIPSFNPFELWRQSWARVSQRGKLDAAVRGFGDHRVKAAFYEREPKEAAPAPLPPKIGYVASGGTAPKSHHSGASKHAAHSVKAPQSPTEKGRAAALHLAPSKRADLHDFRQKIERGTIDSAAIARAWDLADAVRRRPHATTGQIHDAMSGARAVEQLYLLQRMKDVEPINCLSDGDCCPASMAGALLGYDGGAWPEAAQRRNRQIRQQVADWLQNDANARTMAANEPFYAVMNAWVTALRDDGTLQTTLTETAGGDNALELVRVVREFARDYDFTRIGADSRKRLVKGYGQYTSKPLVYVDLPFIDAASRMGLDDPRLAPGTKQKLMIVYQNGQLPLIFRNGRLGDRDRLPLAELPNAIHLFYNGVNHYKMLPSPGQGVGRPPALGGLPEKNSSEGAKTT